MKQTDFITIIFMYVDKKMWSNLLYLQSDQIFSNNRTSHFDIGSTSFSYLIRNNLNNNHLDTYWQFCPTSYYGSNHYPQFLNVSFLMFPFCFFEQQQRLTACACVGSLNCGLCPEGPLNNERSSQFSRWNRRSRSVICCLPSFVPLPPPLFPSCAVHNDDTDPTRETHLLGQNAATSGKKRWEGKTHLPITGVSVRSVDLLVRGDENLEDVFFMWTVHAGPPAFICYGAAAAYRS